MTGERKIVGIRPPSDIIAAEVPSDGARGDGVAPDNIAPSHSVGLSEWSADDHRDDDVGGVHDGALSRMLRWSLHAGALAWIALALWLGTGGFTVAPTVSDIPQLVQTILPALMLWALATLVLSRISTQTHVQQVAVLRQLQSEYAGLDDRLLGMHAHWRDADRLLQERAASLVNVGFDTVARLHDAGAEIEAIMQRCTAAAAALADRSEAGQRQLDSLVLAVPRLEEITIRLSDNLRQAGQSAYQFGGQFEAQIANIGVEAATAGTALIAARDGLAQQIAALQAASDQAQASLAAGTSMLNTAAEQQRDHALTLLAEFAASASEATTQSAAQIAMARGQARSQMEQDSEGLQALLVQISNAADDLRSLIDAATGQSVELRGALSEQAEAARDQLAAVEADGRDRMATLTDALTLLSDGMATFRERAAAGDDQAVAMIQRAETLLIALDSATREIDETVPGALTRLTGHADNAEATIARLSPLAQAEAERVAQIDARLQSIAATLAAQQDRIAALGGDSGAVLDARQAELGAVEAGLNAIELRMAGIANGPMADFTSALAAVEEEAGATLNRTEAAVDRLVTAASERAATDLSATIDRVAGAGINERLAAMSGHADQAVAAATAASDRLMRQLITIADSSAALEQRAQEISALSAGVERETLARQMALLGEALQSTAVDLTRILDMDVADQAWEAYLKGDRSIFVRRAAKLLSTAEARDLLRRYESDDGFKGQVNRYIHDFEAMLRGVMDTRDGHALSVTLLSSDIGKLYVALAQAIERLRR